MGIFAKRSVVFMDDVAQSFPRGVLFMGVSYRGGCLIHGEGPSGGFKIQLIANFSVESSA